MVSPKQRIEPGPGQESVWDYPRPPRLEPESRCLRIVVDGHELAKTNAALRMLETSHPPVYYFPPSDVDLKRLRAENHGTFCEWKGHAHYYSIVSGDRLINNAAWYYTQPTRRYSDLSHYIAFYPSKVDEAWVGEVQVTSQPGDFYGGWITPDIVGPFKGGAGTLGW